MRRNAYFLMWTLFASIFFAHTTPRLWVDLHREKIPAPSPTTSIDRRLEPVLNLAQPSATLIRTFAQLPVDCTLVVICPDDKDDWDFVSCAISYLTWPRKVDTVRLGPNESFADNPSELSALLFCGWPAPSNTDAARTTIGPKLVLLVSAKPK